MLKRRALIGGAVAALAAVALPSQAAIPVRPRRAMTGFWAWLMDLRPRDAAEADRMIRAGIVERLGPLPAQFRSPDGSLTVTVHGYEGLDLVSRWGGAARFRVTLPLMDVGPSTDVAMMPIRFAEA